MSERRPRIAAIRELRASDGPRLLEAFDHACSAIDPSHRSPGEAVWRRKYFENPAGLRAQVAVDGEDRVLAQYAGLPQRVTLDGQWVSITQGVDSFSAPEVRALGKRGAFVQTGEAFAAAYGGAVGEGDPWMWGLPVDAARRVGERFLGYERVRFLHLFELTEPPLGRGGASIERGMPSLFLEESGAFDALNASLLERPGVWTERSALALHWRYGPPSSRDYQVLLQFAGEGGITGYAVLTRGNIDGRQGLLLCELFDVDGNVGALVQEAWQVGGGQPLICTASPTRAEFRHFQDLGFRVRGSSRLIVGRSYDRTYPLEFWRENWPMSLGDTDLC